MSVEIERKFLVKPSFTTTLATSHAKISQGYLATTPTVRVRIADDEAYLTIKGKTTNISRLEFEYPIPLADAKLMLSTLSQTPPIEKVRYLVPVGRHTFEVDFFEGANAGLVLAEVELESEGEEFERPVWLGAEVSGDKRYYNSYLSEHPYSTWEN